MQNDSQAGGTGRTDPGFAHEAWRRLLEAIASSVSRVRGKAGEHSPRKLSKWISEALAGGLGTRGSGAAVIRATSSA